MTILIQSGSNERLQGAGVSAGGAAVDLGGASLSRRQVLAGMAGLAGTALLVGCSGSADGAGSASTTAPPAGTAGLDTSPLAPGSPGLVDEDAYQARVRAYLAGAAAEIDPTDVTSIVAALIAAHHDPGYTWDPAAVTVPALEDRWDQIDEWRDTRDFAFNYLHWVLGLADGATPMRTVDSAVIEAIEQRLVDNRFRYDDPMPADRVDHQWYWSENHLLIFAVVEYLAGQRMPDRTFTVTGLTGAEHMARTKPRILEWVAERARFGFSEWHSTTYMRKNIEPLGTLIEFADDPELVQAATIGLDLCLLDMAGHCHAGKYSASQGRNYGIGHAGTSELDGNSDVIWLVFDSPLSFSGSRGNATNSVAGATRYRPPQVLADMALAGAAGVTRERHGIFVDGADPVIDDPQAPFGKDFDDPENLEFWWSQGAVGLWQLTDISLAESREHRLFESDLVAPVKALVDLNGGDPVRIKPWLRDNHAVVNFGQLREANSYNWRGEHVAMASVLDHRFGQMRDQIRAWQARIDAGTYIFTQHPAKPAPAGGLDDDAKPGYWTGEASVPRSAQHERTSIHIYQPAWDATTVDPILWTVFGYQPETHAFVPQEKFDEVVRDGNWTFARKGDGYLALWSWREVGWRIHEPVADAENPYTQPFDLVAAGGADNVWLCEAGDVDASGSFADFQAACRAQEPDVARDDVGFTMAWRSPSAGDVSFGSTAPFVVNGEQPQQADFPRHESRWGTVEAHTTALELRSDTATLILDTEQLRRAVGAA